ncbi:MAG: FkbM family methyltransferase [Chloroflexota bacterium]
MNKAILSRKLLNLPVRINQIVSQLPYRGRAWWINNIIRHPVWYTDQFQIKSQLRPHENIQHTLATHSHFDDLGTIALIQQLLKTGMTVFDVGAAKGIFSLHAAKLVAPGGQVHAFEPGTYAVTLLRDNLAVSSQYSEIITVNQAAVSDVDGEARLNVFPPAFSDWNTLGQPAAEFRQAIRDANITTEITTVVTLDSYCETHEIQFIDLLKIDVEGYEIEVMQGASKLLSEDRIRYILFEISLVPLEAKSRTARQVLDIFYASNFRVSQIMENGQLLTVEASNASVPHFANYLAYKV